jgi:glycosyltransferase involved in cell wall biosynthesis
MSHPLRVGLNLTHLVEGSGDPSASGESGRYSSDSGESGRYERELIPALIEAEPGIEITAWLGSTAPGALLREPWAGEVRWMRLPVPGIGSPWHLWHELVGIGLAARRRRLDVVHGLANLAPLIKPGVASVVTILDPVWVRDPAATDPPAPVAMRTLVPLCARTSSRVIAVSHAVAERVSRTLRIPLEKLDVTPLGIVPSIHGRPRSDDGAMRARLGLREGPLVLCVAAKRRHKNLDGLIRAMSHVPEQEETGRRPLLVLVGPPSPYEQELREVALEVGVAEDVAFPAGVDEADLEALYAAAGCFVLPSFQEGFPLPILEAMAHGVPVACSDVSSLPEVAGDAALLFDPYDTWEMAHQIKRLLSDGELAEQLVESGFRRCGQFSWRRTAEGTLESYRRALEPNMVQAGPDEQLPAGSRNGSLNGHTGR